MKIRGKALREGQTIQKGILYQIFSSSTLVFEEVETQDIVNIKYDLKDGQYGLYGYEYKNPFAGADNEKKADILILVIDETENKFSSWIMDVKKSVGGEDVIFHMIEQLLASIKHKNALKAYLVDFEEDEHIGYVTRNLELDRVIAAIEKKKEYIESERENIEKVPMLIGTTIERKLLDEKAKLKTLVEFSNNYICENGDIYNLEHLQSEPYGDEQYVYNLTAGV